MKSRLVPLLAITLMLTILPSALYAQEGAALFASKACIACHGAEEKQPINNNIPKLAGQNKGYLAQQLTDFKSGARSNAGAVQMKGITAGLTEDDIQNLAEYLSTL